MASFSRISSGIKASLVAVSWVPVLYCFTQHVAMPYQVRGFSMSPTFNPGTATLSKDVVLIYKWGMKNPNSIKRGDVVMFRSPSDPEKLVIKRVIGLQGEVIKPKQPPYPRKQAKVPRNHLWVEGDNSFHSIDSNTFGPISQGLVVGKVSSIIWPLSRIGADISNGGRDARFPNPKDKLVSSINDI